MNDKKLRVLVAAHFGEPIGGITVYFRTLLGSSYSQQLDVKPVETSQGSLTFDQRGQLKANNWLNALANVWFFWRSLRSERPGVVHIGSANGPSFAKHGLMALLACATGTPVVMQLHFSLERLIPEPVNRFWRYYVLFVLKRVQGIVTLSREWDKLSDILPGATICYVPNAIEVEPYQVIPRPRPENDSVELLFLGHIGHEKGCFDLLAAIEKVRYQAQRPFCLNYVGETLDTGEKEHLVSEIQAKDLEQWVKVHDPEYDEQKVRRLANSDVLILPSYFEGMPMSIIEAMAAGLPVVATMVGGIPDLVVHETTGLLISAGDIDGLAITLVRLIDSPEQRLAMGMAGRQRAVEQFNIETKVKTLVELYNRVASSLSEKQGSPNKNNFDVKSGHDKKIQNR
jgi:glycosyltransferase involved in cell wall biosynthesis